MALSTNDVKVTKIAETTDLDASGRPAQMIAVQWTIGAHGPFTEKFPKAGFDQNAALLKIKELAGKIAMFPTV